MDKKHINKKRLLLNAEAFGFGPTAAIAAFFPYLREKFETISYAGTGHTLDMQRSLAYDAIYDITNDTSGEEFNQICQKHDVFITALDFDMATKAKSCGLQVIIYDPLTWYWKELPSIIHDVELYISQDFIGVRDRLEKDFPNAIVVPPILQAKHAPTKGQHILVNLGGLQNPILPKETLVAYAHKIILGARDAFPDEQILVATSNTIANDIHLLLQREKTLHKNMSVKNYARKEMLTVLANTKFAFMTPGLGNIYDAAQYGIPTTWLPPSNDSQGQQAVLLEKENLCDGFIDWQHIGVDIDYFGEQKKVLSQIKSAIENLNERKLKSLFVAKTPITNKTKELISRFGTNGAQMVADIIYMHLRKQPEQTHA